jgi:hypothetical protein
MSFFRKKLFSMSIYKKGEVLTSPFAYYSLLLQLKNDVQIDIEYFLLYLDFFQYTPTEHKEPQII